MLKMRAFILAFITCFNSDWGLVNAGTQSKSRYRDLAQIVDN